MNLLSSRRLLTMKEYCFPNTTTTSTVISTKRIKQFFSVLGFLCSFFLRFSPLLLKLLSFICIFFLVLLALVFSFFSGANLSSLMENLRPGFEAPDEELECFVDLVGVVESESAAPFDDHGGVSGSLEKNVVEFSCQVEAESCGMNVIDQLEENRPLGNLVSDSPGKWPENPDEEDERSEDELSCSHGKAGPGSLQIGLAVANHKARELNSSSLTSFNGGSHTQQNPIVKTRSFRHDRTDTNYENSLASEHHSQQPMIGHTLSDLGSTRKEKEWRRTLACKLFQERHNVGGDGSIAAGGEGMDMLWEVYERTEEENKGKQREISNEKEEKSKNNKSRIVDFLEEEEGEEVDLCCLKALKFSAGKMHFGMARPGLLSFSKAVKGIRAGWSTHHHHRKKKV